MKIYNEHIKTYQTTINITYQNLSKTDISHKQGQPVNILKHISNKNRKYRNHGTYYATINIYTNIA